MMVLAAEYNDKLGRKPGAIRVVAEKDKDFTSCCFENISDDEVKKNNFRLYPMSYQSRHENKSKAHGITHLSHLTQVILLTHMTYDSLTNNCFSKSDSHRYRHFWLPALVKNN